MNELWQFGACIQRKYMCHLQTAHSLIHLDRHRKPLTVLRFTWTRQFDTEKIERIEGEREFM